MIAAELERALKDLCPEALAPPFAAVAWSGGADSTALLLALLELLEARHGGALPRRLVAIHVDHGLRPDSAQDAAHCARVAAALGGDRVELLTLTLPEGPSLARAEGGVEGPARLGRYRLMGEALRGHGLGVVLTAHHADDNVEGLLLALIRGAGLTGLAGARAEIGLDRITGVAEDASLRAVRPLLGLTRAQLRGWLEARGLAWREDPTNALVDRRRNVLRHQIIPALAALADSPAPMQRAPGILAGERDLLESLSLEALVDAGAARPPWYEAGLCLSREALRRMRRGLAIHAIRLALRGQGRLFAPDAASIEEMVDALRSPDPKPKTFDAGQGVSVAVEASLVVIGARLAATPEGVRWEVPGERAWGGLTLRCRVVEGGREAMKEILARTGLEDRLGVEMFDADALALPLQIRSGAPGERLKRWRGGTKRLGRLLTDAKVSTPGRPWVPVVEDAEGRVMWVAPLFRTDAAPVNEATRRLVVVEAFEARSPRDD